MKPGAWVLLALPIAAAPFDDAAVLLRSKCLPCHSAKARAGGLSVESKEEILRGGKSGPAIVAGKPVDSLLLGMVSTGKMPQGGAKLAPDELAMVRRWIEQEQALPPVEERDVHAILSAKCWVCHGRVEKKAGLDLRTRQSMLRGGGSGAAIVPGDPAASLLVTKIGKQQMPPPELQEQFSVRGLTDEEFEKVKRWIADGAKAGAERPVEVSHLDDAAIRPKDREFWAFRRPVRSEPPPSTGAGSQNPIDAFVFEKLRSSGKSLAREAPAGVLLRRAYFDLTGLPPSPEEIAAYENDRSADRYERLVDRLLASPRYGERWARHWLDAVGYSDTEGGNSADQDRRHAWRYRDYVIQAFNGNLPYDRFLTEQIAGDELFDYRTANPLEPRHLELLAATGFWRTAPDGTNSTEQNFIPERMDVIAGQLEIFGTAVMGLTVGCARCHDHKYDPLPARDYYRLVAILAPAYDPYHWLPGVYPCLGVGAKCDENSSRFYVPKATAEFREAASHNEPIDARIQDLEAQVEEKAKPYREKLAAEKKGDKPSLGELEEAYPAFRKERAALNDRIRKERAKKKELPLIRALFDRGPEPPDTRILLRGDPNSPGMLVSPGVPSIVAAGLPAYRVEPLSHSSGRRLGLAKWLTHPEHPLTARVMVNRMWQQHFGTGLVATPGNFGRMGAAPENQKLLDWLATEFARSGWDMKAMHRLMLTSATYRQEAGETGYRMRRLDAESLRDAILKVSGRLEERPFGVPDPVKTLPDGEVVTESRRRSIYVIQKRTQPVSLLETFDQPFMNPNCVQRGQSVVSSQALHLMNGDLVRENARYMAGRIVDAVGENRTRQVERAYLLALGRRPTADEFAAAEPALGQFEREWNKQLETEQPAEPVRGRAHWLALANLCHTLMNSAEFLYID